MVLILRDIVVYIIYQVCDKLNGLLFFTLSLSREVAYIKASAYLQIFVPAPPKWLDEDY